MIIIYSLSFMVLVIKYKDVKYLIFYCVSLASLITIIVLTRIIYKRANKLITNNMCMLLSVGFIIISRLSFEKAVRQYLIVMLSVIVTSFIPYIITKGPFFSKLKWTYAILGLVALACVLIFSVATNGAKISFTILGVTFQPSEIVKLLFVFAIASFFAKAEGIKDLIVITIISALHVLILVISKDLGGAVILFIVYLCVMYVATCNVLYLTSGLIICSIGSIIGYKLFSHVRVRVNAFIDPFDCIDNAGYQIAQSLFAICSGGLFGMGLSEGMPKTIPVVAADFIYSAISEEFGTIFSACTILICISCFVMFMNIAMKFDNHFYKYVAVGLGILYIFQVFLTVGGVTKFIPLTGVTLPLVSYGGTSVLVTVIMFSIIQGLYIGRE
ncbi:MAG: FtsW/RodA/SpoVE family cell cycle protein [Lachnospiraceae bacterium]|nr:FtsW/RodA/SpoVE family cell cycle protein [Lachnospiraceae bacterium]